MRLDSDFTGGGVGLEHEEQLPWHAKLKPTTLLAGPLALSYFQRVITIINKDGIAISAGLMVAVRLSLIVVSIVLWTTESGSVPVQYPVAMSPNGYDCNNHKYEPTIYPSAASSPAGYVPVQGLEMTAHNNNAYLTNTTAPGPVVQGVVVGMSLHPNQQPHQQQHGAVVQGYVATAHAPGNGVGVVQGYVPVPMQQQPISALVPGSGPGAVHPGQGVQGVVGI